MTDNNCPACGGAIDGESGVCRACATAVQAESGSAAPRASGTEATARPEIPGYQILGELGEGGMGAVYVAEETALGRRVAIKIISGRVAADAQSKARFLREARTLATIEHPHVVRVYAFGEVEGRPYLAMECVDGETLAQRMQRTGPMPVDEALRIARDIVDALEAAWERKIIHRDIKPSNILIDRRNRVRVADFGLARPAHWDGDASLTQSGLMVGTPHYISPEQAQGKDLDFRSDFYSLGIMLFHMLTGHRPFEGSTPVAIVARHLHEPMPPLRSWRTDVPATVDQLILKLTRKEPEERPGTHAELLAVLDALLSRTPPASLPNYSTVALPARSVRRSSLILATAGMFALLVAGAAYYFTRPEKTPPPPAVARSSPTRFVVAVAPFYGPDQDSAKEGRVMAALVERAVAQRLGSESAVVLGIEETKTAVRSHAEARALGEKLAANAVIWGEAFALRRETEVEPHVTIVPRAGPDPSATSPQAGTARWRHLSTLTDSIGSLQDKGGQILKLEAEAPNQIELRKTSASGMGDVVLLLAGIHALENEHSASKALDLLRRAPRSPETLRYQVQALLRSDQTEEARNVLEQSLALDSSHAPSHALLGDLLVQEGRYEEGAAAYQRAAALGTPFTTRRGIYYQGRLYVKETYRSSLYYSGVETDTLFLLAVDPKSGRVLERHSLPGQIETFRIEDDVLVIGTNSHKDDLREPLELRLRDGRFNRPLWHAPNILWRLRSVKGGRVLAGNFIAELESMRTAGDPGGRFVLAAEPAADVPRTLPDLERELRSAADRDPTQPWHLFLLAVLLENENRQAEAKTVFEEMLRRDYPGVPYYHFTWMLNMLERLHWHSWSERLYPKALAQRKLIPQEITFSTLIERLINASFVRQAALNRDPAPGYQALLRAREIGGITPEGEDLVAIAWSRHFERSGDARRAASEREIGRKASAHPFNFLAAAAKVDYAVTAFATAALSFLFLFLLILGHAAGRTRIAPPGQAPSAATAPHTQPIPRLARLAAFALAATALLVAFAYLLIAGKLGTAIAIVALLVGVGTLLRRLRFSPVRALRAISTGERWALFAAWLLVLVAAGFVRERLILTAILAETPFGLADSMGHPYTIFQVEQAVKGRESDPHVRNLLAVLHHYAGDVAKARELYDPASSGPESRNRIALLEGKPPVAAPSAAELARALKGTMVQRWRALWRGEVSIQSMAFQVPLAVSRIFTLGSLALLLLVLAVPHVPIVASQSRRRLAHFVPGLPDVLAGHPGKALVILLLLFAPLLPAVASMRHSSWTPALGFVTTINMPNFSNTFPFPPGDDDLRMHALMPYASVFWAAMALAPVLAMALHVFSVRRMKKPRAEDVATLASQQEAG